MQKSFQNALCLSVKNEVLYNTVNSEEILHRAKEKTETVIFKETAIKLVAVGKLLHNKGFDRLLRIIKHLLKEKYKVYLYILGDDR